MAMITTTVRADESVIAALDMKAESLGIERSDCVRMALQAFIAPSPADELAAALIGGADMDVSEADIGAILDARIDGRIGKALGYIAGRTMDMDAWRRQGRA